MTVYFADLTAAVITWIVLGVAAVTGLILAFLAGVRFERRRRQRARARVQRAYIAQLEQTVPIAGGGR